MLERYENQNYMYVFLKNRMITNITRKCDVFTLYRPFAMTKDVDYKTAINALVDVYYHFLLSDGHIAKRNAVAKNPSLICLNLTKNEKPGGDPVLTIEETKDYLGYLLHGMYKFHNKKCRNTAVIQGMACIIRKLYEPYSGSQDKEIHELYYAIIARGTFVLQMNNKLLARAFYKGLYDLYPYAKDRQKYLCDLLWDTEACYDSVLKHDDVHADPIHDERKYPWNLYRYNVDNLIHTYCAAKEMKTIGEKTGCFSPEEIKKYSQTMDFIYEFFKRISPFYKVRCDYYNGRGNSGLKDGDPVEYYGNVVNTMKNYETLQMDYCPYLYYSCELFKSSDDEKSWLYAGIAKTYTGRDYTSLDHDCAMFGERTRRVREEHPMASVTMAFIDALICMTMVFMVICKIGEWERRTHGLTIMFWVFVGICVFGFMGQASD